MLNFRVRPLALLLCTLFTLPAGAGPSDALHLYAGVGYGHDDNLLRTSDVAEKFPERKERPVSDFTLAELKSLDAGAWFNAAHPERARPSFEGLRILTLDEVIDIAEGGEHKPGLYIETKLPQQFPGIEKDLRDKLAARGWLDGRVRPVALDEASRKIVEPGLTSDAARPAIASLAALACPTRCAHAVAINGIVPGWAGRITRAPPWTRSTSPSRASCSRSLWTVIAETEWSRARSATS